MNKLMGAVAALMLALPLAAAEIPARWRVEWPGTDFSRASVPLNEIQPGGPSKDGIPAIDEPRFVPLDLVDEVAGNEPVIGLVINGDARAYPLRILMWHEIVNDEVGGVPVTVTYCPLCNTSIVFERRLDGRLLDFGTTGNLRHSDLVMYDRQTESWWQQYAGEAIVGELLGKRLTMIPSRLESFDEFKRRAPSGKVLIPNNPYAREYGINPYAGYDESPFPYLFQGDLPDDVAPMMRVVAVEDTAFTLPLVRERGTLHFQGLEIAWRAGQNTALGDRRIERGADVGNVTVQRGGEDVPYVVTFAFAFYAFNPQGTLIQSLPEP